MPSPSPALPADAHLEHVLSLIRGQRATTRPELVGLTGLSRKIVIQRVDQLIAVGLVREGPATASTGGRPAGRLDFVAEAGCVLAVELGANYMTAGLADMSGVVLASRSRTLPRLAPPEVALTRAQELFTRLLNGTRTRGPLRGIGVGVLGPVSPTGLTMDLQPNWGWADFSVADWFGTRYGVRVWVDNEVNMTALGESRSRTGEQSRNLLYVKIGSGIGAGLVQEGRLYRGATGVAGELGHMTVSSDPSLVCWCGNSGCLTTLAGGRSIMQFGVKAMRAGQSPFLQGIPARQIRDTHVVAGAHAGDEACLEIVSRAGEALGLAVAGATNLINPALIVIGGRVGGQAGHLLTEPVRRAVEAHTFPLATQTLAIESADDAYQAGVAGAAATVIDALLSGPHLATWKEEVEDGLATDTEAG